MRKKTLIGLMFAGAVTLLTGAGILGSKMIEWQNNRTVARLADCAALTNVWKVDATLYTISKVELEFPELQAKKYSEKYILWADQQFSYEKEAKHLTPSQIKLYGLVRNEIMRNHRDQFKAQNTWELPDAERKIAWEVEEQTAKTLGVMLCRRID